MNVVLKKKGLGCGFEVLFGGSVDIIEVVKIEGVLNMFVFGKL